MQHTETFGDYAHQALTKHSRKSFKYEAAVLEDKDPEPLHQMRVGMRRLRTALQVFAPALNLPKKVSIKRIRSIAHALGAVRDLDVLQVELETHYHPQLETAEQQKLDLVFKKLAKQRRHHLAHMQEVLSSENYAELKQSFKDWLAKPKYQPAANLPIFTVLPDLLLPLTSELLLHPAWLVGTKSTKKGFKLVKTNSCSKIDQLLQAQGKVLHDLRKQVKRVRYQAELFAECYGDDFTEQIKNFQAMQEVLGQLQDSFVLREFLSQQLDIDAEKALPGLSQLMQTEQAQQWHKWQEIQQQYLATEFRQALRQQMLMSNQLEATTIPADGK